MMVVCCQLALHRLIFKKLFGHLAGITSQGETFKIIQNLPVLNENDAILKSEATLQHALAKKYSRLTAGMADASKWSSETQNYSEIY